MKSPHTQMALAGLIVLLQLTGCDDRGNAGRVSPELAQSPVSTAVAAAPIRPETVDHDLEPATIADLSAPSVVERPRLDPSPRERAASAARPRAPIQARSVATLPVNSRAERVPRRRSIEPIEPALEPSQPSSEQEQAKPSLEPERPTIERPRLPRPAPSAPALAPSVIASQPPASSFPGVSLSAATSLGVGAVGLVAGFMGTELYAKEPSGGAVALSLLGAAAAGVGFTMAGVMIFARDDAQSPPASEVRLALGPGSMILNGTF
jgi:hypothetical protein